MYFLLSNFYDDRNILKSVARKDSEIIRNPQVGFAQFNVRQVSCLRRFLRPDPHLALQKGSQASHGGPDSSYPKDEPGEEVSERARVWRVYLDETGKFDVSLTEGCNRGIDVLLVFVSKHFSTSSCPT